MSDYNWALYAHLIGVALLFSGIGIEWRLVALIREAQSVQQLQAWTAMGKGLDKLLPVVTVLILVSGGYMVEDLWAWDAAWIDVSLAALVLMSVVGSAFNGRRLQRISVAAAEAPAGPLPADLERVTRDPVLWASAQMLAFASLGLVYVMIVKPGLGEALSAVLIAALVGLLLSLAWPTGWTSAARAPGRRLRGGPAPGRVQTLRPDAETREMPPP